MTCVCGRWPILVLCEDWRSKAIHQGGNGGWSLDWSRVSSGVQLTCRQGEVYIIFHTGLYMVGHRISISMISHLTWVKQSTYWPELVSLITHLQHATVSYRERLHAWNVGTNWKSIGEKLNFTNHRYVKPVKEVKTMTFDFWGDIISAILR